jgi:iron complex transport system ATP-binding protein
LDLEFRPGVHILLGPNGAGKSSLLALITGLLRPTNGRVLVEGRDSWRLPALTRAGLIALSPQTLPPVFGISTADFIAAGTFRKTHHIYAEPNAALDNILDRADLSSRREQDFVTLSGGEKRRALLARALLQDAAWTLLDEPTSSLDYAHNRALLTLLRGLRREGRNLIIVTHDADYAAAVQPDRIILMRGGKLFFAGPPYAALSEEILREVYGAPFTRTPEGRVLPGYE